MHRAYKESSQLNCHSQQLGSQACMHEDLALETRLKLEQDVCVSALANAKGLASTCSLYVVQDTISI